MTALRITIDFTTFQHAIINLQLTIFVTIFGLSSTKNYPCWPVIQPGRPAHFSTPNAISNSPL